jgi:hypothetical protein
VAATPHPMPAMPAPARDTVAMATVTTVLVERSGPAIQAALAEHAPDERGRFEAEFRQALTRAAVDLDLASVDAVLTRWHALATMAANPLTSREHEQLLRAKAGDLSGLRARDEHGTWTTL